MASVTSQEPTPGDRPGVVGRTRNGTVTYQASPVMPSPTASSQPGSSSSSPWSSTAPAQRPSNETRTSTATLIPEDLDGLRIVTTPTKAKYSSDAGYSARSSTSRKGKERDDGTFDEGNDGDDWAPSQGPAFVSSSTRDSEPGRKAKGTLGIGAVNLRSSKSARIKWSVLHGDGEDIGRADGMDDDEDDEQGRMGLVGSSGRGNGGRQKIMDLEQGYGAGSSAGGSADAGAYPPLSEEELEEKRIQEVGSPGKPSGRQWLTSRRSRAEPGTIRRQGRRTTSRGKSLQNVRPTRKCSRVTQRRRLLSRRIGPEAHNGPETSESLWFFRLGRRIRAGEAR